MSKMIRMIFIDPYTQTITESEIKDGLQSYYDLIGNNCRLVETVYPEWLGTDVIYVDEEGLYNQICGFQVADWPHTVMGRGIVVGTGDRGDTISATVSLELVQSKLTGWHIGLGYVPPTD